MKKRSFNNFTQLSNNEMRMQKGGKIIASGGSGTAEDPYWTMSDDGTIDLWPPCE